MINLTNSKAVARIKKVSVDIFVWDNNFERNQNEKIANTTRKGNCMKFRIIPFLVFQTSKIAEAIKEMNSSRNNTCKKSNMNISRRNVM